MRTEAEAALADLLDEVAAQQRRLSEALQDPEDRPTLLEAQRWLLSILQVAADVHVWADQARPRFVDIVGPYKKWGGDNADAFYGYAPIDPDRTYRVEAVPGDAVYLSLTIYGGPRDGRYSERIVGSRNSREAPPGPDGVMRLVLSPEDPADGTPWVRLEPDAVCAITRDYLADPRSGRRAVWSISADGPPARALDTDAELARRLRAARTWVSEQAQMVPLPLGEPNQVDEPYPVPTTTFGWAAGDAAYAMGAFDLAADQALVLRGRSPDCAFWNLCLWNPLLHTYNYDYERVTINGFQVEYEPDGSWVVVVADADPGHPNWISTAGHRRGRLWFRWFLPESTPERPSAEVVPLGSRP